MENSLWVQEQYTVPTPLQIPHSKVLVEMGVRNVPHSLRRPTIIRPYRRSRGTRDKQMHSVTHARNEPWMLAGIPRLQECAIYLSALACVVSCCGALTDCSKRSELPPLWRVSLPSHPHFSQMSYFLHSPHSSLSDSFPPNSSQPILPSNTLHPPDIQAGSGVWLLQEAQDCGCPNPLSFQAFKNH